MGTVHRHIVPYNIVIDSDTNNLHVFNFHCAASVGRIGFDLERDDANAVISTLYEIITHYYGWTADYIEQGQGVVMNLAKWPVQIKLDGDIEIFRKHLSAYLEWRKQGVDGIKSRRINPHST